MTRQRRAAGSNKKKKSKGDGAVSEKVKDYRHDEKRPNNPPAGLVTYDKTPPSRKVYSYDPHLDPQLVWAGKAERPSFDVENVALHIHERISTAAIIRAVQREELQRALKGLLDPENFEALRGTVSLPFQPGKHKRVAVKVFDQRGNKVIRILSL